MGIEPTYKSFADSRLTAWLRRHNRCPCLPAGRLLLGYQATSLHSVQTNFYIELLVYTERSEVERETGIEPATFSLARRRSTDELLPHTRGSSVLGVLPQTNAGLSIFYQIPLVKAMDIWNNSFII